jgi:hypothetical protein
VKYDAQQVFTSLVLVVERLLKEHQILVAIRDKQLQVVTDVLI